MQIANMRARAFRVGKTDGRMLCNSCGKTAMHCPVRPVKGENGKLGVWCSRCGRCFFTISAGPEVPAEPATDGSALAL